MSKETKKASCDIATKQVKQKAESIVYIGPNIAHVVRHANVFVEGKLPEAVETTIKDFPIIKRLFVPVSGMQEAMKELRKESALASIYSQVADKYK